MEEKIKKPDEQELVSTQDLFKELNKNLKQRIEELQNQTIETESVLLEDNAQGLKVVLQSSKFGADQLLNLGLQSFGLMKQNKINNQNLLGVG